jgi:pullulanase/glycogen debranching enzyme
VGWLLAASAAAAPAPDLADCDRDEPHTVLAPVRSAVPAGVQAVWLDARRLQWPGVQDAPDRRYRLVGSATAALMLPVGGRAQGVEADLPLQRDDQALPAEVAGRFRHVAAGLRLSTSAPAARLAALHRGQVLLVQEDAAGRVLQVAAVQHAGALDDLYAEAERATALGAQPSRRATRFALWAPTAQRVQLCLYPGPRTPARTVHALARDAATGIWSARFPRPLAGHHYLYLVDVVVPGVGLVRQRVTDPYALSLSADSRRAMVIDLDAPDTQPPGWRTHPQPRTVQAAVDQVIYELHVRDFSVSDASVRPAWRGKYLAFTEPDSAGMRHLRALARAGLTDVHLLPVFDIATIPEQGCATPAVPAAPPDAEVQQAAVTAAAATDCFNWGYDPFHYTAPEGSYATDADDGRARILELRRMVMALHAAGLRVGMDVVYNHTSAAGQHAQSVLDRIVPGYYHRLDAQGRVERSTCCENTATEHRMMARLMSDSVLAWARHHRIDAFRFDLMGHQPKAVMVALQARLKRELKRDIHLIGEGWNFGEVANGARFEQASQLSLNGTGIGTFSDRARDALRGRGALQAQGWLNGLGFDPLPGHAAAPAGVPGASAAPVGTAASTPSAAAAAPAAAAARQDLLRAADLARVGLAGSLRRYAFRTHQGDVRPAERMAYGDQPAGYVSQPGEVVNYVENHDNQTLFDDLAAKLPPATSAEDRARVQVLGAATVAFSQGIAYFHAGQDILRSKSMDGNSFDSGDWFNPLDWTYQDNGFGRGLPPRADNEKHWPLQRPLLADARLKPGPASIAWARDAFRDLLAIRASSTLFRLRSADDVLARLTLHNTGPDQVPTVLVGQLDGRGYPGAGFSDIVCAINAGPQAQTLGIEALKGRAYRLHPVHRAPGAADQRVAAEARHDPQTGRLTVPARSAVVWVAD